MTKFAIHKDYGQRLKITYHLADAAEQRPTMPRIPGIGAGNSPSDLGFLESDLDGTHDGIRFQESKLETDTARADFENRCKKRGRRGLQCGKASHFHLIIYFESHDKERL